MASIVQDILSNCSVFGLFHFPVPFGLKVALVKRQYLLNQLIDFVEINRNNLFASKSRSLNLWQELFDQWMLQ